MGSLSSQVTDSEGNVHFLVQTLANALLTVANNDTFPRSLRNMKKFEKTYLETHTFSS